MNNSPGIDYSWLPDAAMTEEDTKRYGSRVSGEWSLGKLVSVGAFRLDSDRFWPTIDGKRARFTERIRSLFASEEQFLKEAQLRPPPRSSAARATIPSYRPHIEELLAQRVLVTAMAALYFGVYFAVSKTDMVTARAIFALNSLNEACAPPPRFGLFTVEALLRAILRVGPGWTAVWADMSNWYYQLALPSWATKYMAIL